jgi:transcriptional antiterminator NusG
MISTKGRYAIRVMIDLAEHEQGQPVPLKDEEGVAMGVERIPIVLNIEVGETVRVVSGPLENFLGKVEKIDPERQKVKLTVSMFGRETPVELDFIQVQKI